MIETTSNPSIRKNHSAVQHSESGRSGESTDHPTLVADKSAGFVLTGSGNIVEVQATAEKTPFSEQQFSALLGLARKGVAKLVDLQKMAVM